MTYDQDNITRAYRFSDEALIGRIPVKGSCIPIAISPDGSLIALHDFVWNPFMPLLRMRAPNNVSFQFCFFTTDGTRLVGVPGSGSVAVYGVSR